MVKRLLVKKQEEFLPELTQEIPANGIITVGKDSSATIELDDETVAPEQFVIVCEDDSMTLLCRVDGTEVNGEDLAQGALHNLQSGDVITIGDFTLIPETEEDSDALSDLPLTVLNSETAQFELPLFDNSKSVETPATTPEKTERSLTDVLEGLRSEEKFYFLIKDTEQGSRRIYVETEEMWLGWSASGICVLTVVPDEVEIPRAQIRKDWSGVVLYPLQNGNVWLNDETLTEPHRLKNDDKLFLLAKEGAKLNLETVIKFHEPTALLILDSILPKELPPPILLDASANDIGDRELDESDLIHSSKVPPAIAKARRNRQIFGYFTVTEIIIMAIGTLITAAVIFLILEWY
jgi:pSer/pThr/pTyr-binding forkhead associated (FHA) protein